jgi:hypothetical protein
MKSPVSVLVGEQGPGPEQILPEAPQIGERVTTDPEITTTAAPKALVGAIEITSLWQADLTVKSIQAEAKGSAFRCRAKIRKDGKDSAHDATVRILLPVGVEFLRSRHCKPSDPNPDAKNVRGFAACDLGQLQAGQSHDLSVATTLPPKGVDRTCGAFVWSKTPDPKPSNNYKDASAQD